ncbi:MAG: hypothetical protein PHW08_07165 [Kiritimatiellae bacterium]|nr:hypothetical protein [Kiritimatiellia bacterium]
MTLKADLTTDLTAFFATDEFAESVTYTAKGSKAATITVILADEDPAIEATIPPGDRMIVLAKYADVSAPRRGDTFTINSETWHVVGEPAGGRAEGIWHIEVSRSARRQLEG